MKNLRLLGLLLVAALAFSACAPKTGEAAPQKKKGAATADALPAPFADTSASAPVKPAKPQTSILAKIIYYANPLNLIPKKAKPPVALAPRLVGVIKMVNQEDQYVLIDAISQNLAAGDLLLCITNQKETANLRMSSLKNPPFLIADIASGHPSVGDRVFKP